MTLIDYSIIFSVDDVFVRQDLYEGKYAPDLEQQRKMEALDTRDEIVAFYDSAKEDQTLKKIEL